MEVVPRTGKKPLILCWEKLLLIPVRMRIKNRFWLFSLKLLFLLLHLIVNLIGIIISMDRIGSVIVMKAWNKVLWICQQEKAWKYSRKIKIFKRENAIFNYQNISKDHLEAYYETNLFKVRTEEGYSFGTLKDVDGTLYQAYEIHFHTPGEHKINGLQIDMEIQVIHKATEGNMKNQAILSFLYKRTPGAIKPVFDCFDILNLPNPVYNKIPNSIVQDINVKYHIYRVYF
jgi:hypothetical protein